MTIYILSFIDTLAERQDDLDTAKRIPSPESLAKARAVLSQPTPLPVPPNTSTSEEKESTSVEGNRSLEPQLPNVPAVSNVKPSTSTSDNSHPPSAVPKSPPNTKDPNFNETALSSSDEDKLFIDLNVGAEKRRIGAIVESDNESLFSDLDCGHDTPLNTDLKGFMMDDDKADLEPKSDIDKKDSEETEGNMDKDNEPVIKESDVKESGDNHDSATPKRMSPSDDMLKPDEENESPSRFLNKVKPVEIKPKKHPDFIPPPEEEVICISE